MGLGTWTALIWMSYNKWWALVNMVMNIRFPQNARNYSTSSSRKDNITLSWLFLLVSKFGSHSTRVLTDVFQELSLPRIWFLS